MQKIAEILRKIKTNVILQQPFYNITVEEITNAYEELEKLNKIEKEHIDLLKLVKPKNPTFQFYNEDGEVIDTIKGRTYTKRESTIKNLRYRTKEHIEHELKIAEIYKLKDFVPKIDLVEVAYIPIDAFKIDDFT